MPLVADTSIGALAQADAALALEYGRCRARHEAMVAAYESLWSAIRDAAEGER